MKPYQHILVPVDFSQASQNSVQRAADLAQHYQAKLSLLHVVEDLSLGKVAFGGTQTLPMNATAKQNQIVLNWMNHLGFKPEVFSTSLEHIKENWEAMQFKMEEDDYEELTEFRVPGYIPPKINWDNIGNGDSIVPPIMGFEEDYLAQKS